MRTTSRALITRWVVALSLCATASTLPPPATAAATQQTPLDVPADGQPGFTLLPPVQTGLSFSNLLSDARAAENQIRLNGSGVALGDVDRDGLIDIFLCGLDSPNRLYRNLGGWRFEDITGTSPIALPELDCSGAAFADVDGDGDLDLLIAAIGAGVRLFTSDGRGGFEPRSDSGLLQKGGAMTLALADIDGDTDLDLYVANYRTTTIRTTGFALLNVNGRRVVPPALRDHLEITTDGRVLEHGEPDILYLNDGGGRFRAVIWSGGRFIDETGTPLRKAPFDWGLTAMFRDINGDAAPDLYVCNDFHSPDRFWLNDGSGGFRLIPALALRHTSTFSMSVDFADADRDGHDDFFVADMLDPRRRRRMVQHNSMEPNAAPTERHDDRPQYAHNTFFWNRGDMTFAELAHFAGIEATGWSWSTAFLDVDLDGWEDILLTTGHLFDVQNLDAAARIDRNGPYRRDQIPGKLLGYPRLSLPNVALRNLRNRRFTDASAQWGFNDSGVSHGLAMADLDNDGDLDLVVNHLNRPAGLYRNNAIEPRVAVRLSGSGRNTAGIGARVSLVSPELTQTQEISAGGRYLSSDAPERVFAWPFTNAEARLIVRWRSGRTTTLAGVKPNHRYVITEESADEHLTVASAASPAASPWFIEVTDRLNHRHIDEPYDDFSRQPLLPRKLSQSGPGLAWHDLNADGCDDLIIGTGRGGHIALFENDRGRFTRRPLPEDSPPATGDVTGIISHPGGHGAWIAALSNYEDTDRSHSVIQIREGSGTIRATIATSAAAINSLAAADFDADGDLDLFAAGRCLPGRYPMPAGSLLLRHENGQWLPDARNNALLESVGLVTAAAWSDLTCDGFPELILACEWGPLRLFRNSGGTLEVWDPVVRYSADLKSDAALIAHPSPAEGERLSRWLGLWTTLATGDLDGDGQPDLLAGNWGENSSWRPTGGHPVRIYFGDFNRAGSVDLIEAQYDHDLGTEVPIRDLLALRHGVPRLTVKYPTHSAYSTASVDELLGDALQTAQRLEAVILSSMVFLNRGDHFQARRLPEEVQWSPTMGASIADFDGDGDQDAFIAQNFFAVHSAMPRQDAGRGLLLWNDGRANLSPVRGTESGLRIYGEQRGSAVADFDMDGRVDLAVGQNRAETRLFRNARARPGLRVRVAGPPGNPRGVGVALRLVQGDRRGPVVEIQSGTGGPSQDSAVQVLGMGDFTGPLELEARWPGGNLTRTPIPPDTRELTISPPR